MKDKTQLGHNPQVKTSTVFEVKRCLTETQSKLTLTHSGNGGSNPKLHMIY